MMTTSEAVAVKLNECVTAKAKGETVKICLTSIEDSRCPKGVDCIWAGYAAVSLTTTVNNSVRTFTLSTTTRSGFPPKDTTVDNHRFQLTKVLPYPGDGSNVSPRIELQLD